MGAICAQKIVFVFNSEEATITQIFIAKLKRECCSLSLSDGLSLVCGVNLELIVE